MSLRFFRKVLDGKKWVNSVRFGVFMGWRSSGGDVEGGGEGRRKERREKEVA